VQVAGSTLLEHAAGRFTRHPRIGEVVMVAPAALVAHAGELVAVPIVAGGATRRDSVAAGLAALRGDAEFVLVHDVARPFVPAEVIDDVLAHLDAGADAVVPVVGIHDTVRRLDASGALDGLVDRSTLAAIQTPQGFRRDVLVRAHEAGADLNVTDDAALVEALGLRVEAARGSDDSFKITTPGDLAHAEAVARLG
jgi:2-C-methyl-D-erythritol 4-phosphate cytidylyltransferase